MTKWNKYFFNIQCVFLFWLIWHAHNLVIFWAKIKFLDIFHIYIPFIFCKKKFEENFFKTLNFIAVFVKVMILRNNTKILFLKFSKIFKFSNFYKFNAKSKFFDSFCLNFNVCTNKRHFFFIFGLNYQKLKNCAKKLKILELSPKLVHFLKTTLKISSCTIVLNFFYKIWSEYRYEKCPRT